MQISNLKTAFFIDAIRGLRNSYGSHAKMDSYENDREFFLGKEDALLIRKLVKKGSSHRKFLRQVMICCDIRASLKWFDQFDQYRVGVVTNSTSQMHTLGKRYLVQSDFLNPISPYYLDYLNGIIDKLKNKEEDGGKGNWNELINSIPQSILYTRTTTLNYEVVLNILNQRRNHKLGEWNVFIEYMENDLPYLYYMITKEI